MQQIPVYVFTGFLDSGKTKFIQETFEDPRFNAGERTLLLAFEEGEEEYDFSTYPHQNVFLEVLDQATVTTKELAALAKKHKVERVVAELNGMQQIGDLYMRFPEEWVVAQEVMFADSTTFQAYNANMRNLMMDKMVGAQMIVFNRMEKGADVMPFHKIARAANRRVDILYDYIDESKRFKSPVKAECRSLMNVPFVTGDADKDAAFIKYCTKNGLVNIKGHRNVGGMRASIYNAMPVEGVKKLVEVMKAFEKENA